FARAISEVIQEEARLYAVQFRDLTGWLTGTTRKQWLTPDQVVERWAIVALIAEHLDPTDIAKALAAALGLSLSGILVDLFVDALIGTIAGVGMPVIGIAILILKLNDFARARDFLVPQIAEQVAQSIRDKATDVEAQVKPKISQKMIEFREQFEIALRASISSDILQLQEKLDQVISEKKKGEADLETKKERIRNLSDRLDQLLNSINAELLGYVR
ncbi:MAG: hypothetical protein RMJ82_15450, partial [Gemmatales bacterium]|nr:hypothetical protein [Gemmatales bacterium]